MARPTKYTKLILFRATPEEHAYLMKNAAKEKVSMAQVIRNAIASTKVDELDCKK